MDLECFQEFMLQSAARHEAAFARHEAAFARHDAEMAALNESRTSITNKIDRLVGNQVSLRESLGRLTKRKPKGLGGSADSAPEN